MKTKQYYQRGYGGLGMFIGAFFIGVLMYFYFFPSKYDTAPLTPGKSTSNYCSDIIDSEDAPTITVPSTGKKYRLIKQNVPMNSANYPDTPPHHHFGSSENFQDPQTGKKYIIRNPAGGRSYKFASDTNPDHPVDFEFAPYGIIMLFHANDLYEPVDTGLTVSTYGQNVALYVADLYKEVGKPPLPDWVTQCQDFPENQAIEEALIAEQNYTIVVPIGSDSLYFPADQWSSNKAEQQLAYFLPQTNKFLHHTWWTPHCKPAIYLYPEKEQTITVQVALPYGQFLYTDPIYPTGGWNVRAKPTGEITYLGKTVADSKGIVNYPTGVFPYLYYEAKLSDKAIQKPTTGFVKRYEELATFYDELLPKLGLNEKESKEFKEYWIKALPKASYYFIGVVDEKNVDTLAPLTITPKQETTIRVSVYFEALDTFKVVMPPVITTPTRTGFTVVEWGGMVKQDTNHPFTCMQ